MAEALEGRNILKAFLLLAIWGFVVVASVLAFYAYEIPTIVRNTDLRRHPSIILEARDGTVFARHGDYRGDTLSVRDLPPHLVQAFLAVEDRRFYDHGGIDFWGILRAAVSNLFAGHVVQGGSTITQQLAKNLFLGPQRTLRRKMQEAMLSLWLENKLTKDEILSAYLNRVYLGSGAYGVDAAARLYFNKSAKDVSVREAAILAGLPRAPSRYSPLNNPELAETRSRVVLQTMVEAGYLLPSQKAESVTQSPLPVRKPGGGGEGRYFVDWTIEQLGDLIEEQDEDVIIRTTLDLPMQKEAERQVDGILAENATSGHVTQAALVSIGAGGAVRSMVGGRDYAESSFNRAVQAKRQPGSAFKPFVFLTAIQKGSSPSDTILDAPLKIGKWSPENFNDQYKGDVSMKDALAYSLNTATVRLAQKVGVSSIRHLAEKMGITSTLRNDASIALGTSEVSLLDITSAYAVVAQQGRAVLPYAIESIKTKSGKTLYERAHTTMPYVVDSDDTDALDDMLKAAVNYGTGKKAELGIDTAGKTGTTQDYRDAWFIGYAERLTTGVWLGNDDNAAMNKVTGGTLPAQLWHDFMQSALKTGTEEEEEPAYTTEQSGGFKRFLDGLFSGKVSVEQEYPARKR